VDTFDEPYSKFPKRFPGDLTFVRRPDDFVNERERFFESVWEGSVSRKEHVMPLVLVFDVVEAGEEPWAEKRLSEKM
jgi:hypothetical protein